MAGDDREYIPGVCNIGVGEIKKRRALGWIGLAATIVLWTTFIVLTSPAPWRLLLFVPALLAALGFIQSKQGFWLRRRVQIRAKRRPTEYSGTGRFSPQRSPDGPPHHRLFSANRTGDRCGRLSLAALTGKLWEGFSLKRRAATRWLRIE